MNDQEYEDEYSCPYQNYLRIINTIEELENEFRVSEDWYEEHKKHISKYREVFTDFREVNQDNEDEKFRGLAEETEYLMISLIAEINETGFFTLDTYLVFNKHLIDMHELAYTDDELISLFGRLGV